jgi:chromatin remodeling complex protein RSC6
MNTMSKAASTSTPAVKKVSKKSDAETPVAVAAVAAVAAPVKKAKATTAAPAAAAAAATAAPAAAAAPAPVATAVAEVAAGEVKTIEQEIAGLIATHQTVRDESIAAIKTRQRFQKRVAKDLKEAGRRRRRVKKEDDGTVKEKRPTIFTTPVTIKDELCVFLNKPKGTQMTPADVTRAFSAYVETHKLKDAEKGHTIHPDAAMRKVLGVKDDETLTYRNIQSFLYKLYLLPEKKKAATA